MPLLDSYDFNDVHINIGERVDICYENTAHPASERAAVYAVYNGAPLYLYAVERDADRPVHQVAIVLSVEPPPCDGRKWLFPAHPYRIAAAWHDDTSEVQLICAVPGERGASSVNQQLFQAWSLLPDPKPTIIVLPDVMFREWAPASTNSVAVALCTGPVGEQTWTGATVVAASNVVHFDSEMHTGPQVAG